MNDRTHMFIDFHVLQTVPPSCINRDDTGSPKSAYYGGTLRARVSSQAWKRAIRKYFESESDLEMGIRSRVPMRLLADRIQLQESHMTRKTSEELALKILSLINISTKEKARKEENAESKSSDKGTFFFITNAEVDALASLALRYYTEKPNKAEEKQYKEDGLAIMTQHPTADIALFGRMSASEKMLSVDAACQVAHAISTHAVNMETDYFICADDYLNGSGHIGITEFNSSTLYRYATIGVDALMENEITKEEVAHIVTEFAKAFVLSMPTGKQNSFANGTLPGTVYVTLRTDQPLSLVPAFEKPVYSENGYMEVSEKKMADYAEKLYETYDMIPEESWTVGGENFALGTHISMKKLYEALETEINKRLGV